MKFSLSYLFPFRFAARLLGLLAVLQFLQAGVHARGQAPQKRLHIAVIVPLYLDSAFDAAGNYRYGKTLPAFMTAGLESYLGFEAAIDTLQRENAPVDIRIYDSRSAKTNPETLLKTDSLATADLIIGHVNVNEASLLARYASGRKIPFVNTHLPNDAGSVRNPYHIVLNPTLNTHCQGIYKYLQQNHPLTPVHLFTKTGGADDRIRGFFKEAEKRTASVPLNLKQVSFTDSIPAETLAGLLDSTQKNVIVIGSLDLNTALTCCRQLAALAKTYPITVVGMPNWEQVDFTKPMYRGLEIIYGNSLYIKPDNKTAQQLQQQLKSRYYTRTTENTFRAYEALFAIAHLDPAADSGLLRQLQHIRLTLLGEWDIAPVTNKTTAQTDYSENKKINYILKLDGAVKTVY